MPIKKLKVTSVLHRNSLPKELVKVYDKVQLLEAIVTERISPPEGHPSNPGALKTMLTKANRALNKLLLQHCGGDQEAALKLHQGMLAQDSIMELVKDQDDWALEMRKVSNPVEYKQVMDYLKVSSAVTYDFRKEGMCWLWALHQSLGVSMDVIRADAIKIGWDQNPEGALSLADTIFIAKKHLGYMPDFSATKKSMELKLTPKQVEASKIVGKKNGMVFTKNHVMPLVKGKVSNFNGWGEEPVTVICTYTRT